MTERPDIARCADAATFRKWYYLKDELVAFARKNGIKATGGKFEIADRIAYFLDHGTPPVEAKKPKSKQSKFDWHSAPLSPETVITDIQEHAEHAAVHASRYPRI